MCHQHDNDILNICSKGVSFDPLKKAKHCSAAKKKIQINQLQVMNIFKQNTGSMEGMNQNVSKDRVKLSGKMWYSNLINYIISVTLTNNGNCTDSCQGDLDKSGFPRDVACVYL